MPLTLFLSSFDPISLKQLDTFSSVLFHDGKRREDRKILLLFLEGENLVVFSKRKKMADKALLDRFGDLESFQLLSVEKCCLEDGLLKWLQKEEENVEEIYFNLEDSGLVSTDVLSWLLENKKVIIDSTYSSSPYKNGQDLSLPFPVLEYIGKKKLYYAKTVSSFLNEHRYLHSLSVASTAYKMTMKNGRQDLAIKAYTAGLYHDIAKDLTSSYLKEIVKSHYSDRKPVENFAWHQFAGAYLTNELFKIKDKEILEAIEYHCTGKEKMTFLQKILYASDKVEPLREFKTEEIRTLCNKNIDEGFIAVLEDQKRYFDKNNIDYKTNDYTKKMYEYYFRKGA